MNIIEYVLRERQAQRLSNGEAVDLISQVFTRAPAIAPLHPLVQENTSDLHGLRFSTSLIGDQSKGYVRHQRDGYVLLEGGGIDMARAVACRVHETLAEAAQVSGLILDGVEMAPVHLPAQTPLRLHMRVNVGSGECLAVCMYAEAPADEQGHALVCYLNAGVRVGRGRPDVWATPSAEDLHRLDQDTWLAHLDPESCADQRELLGDLNWWETTDRQVMVQSSIDGQRWPGMETGEFRMPAMFESVRVVCGVVSRRRHAAGWAAQGEPYVVGVGRIHICGDLVAGQAWTLIVKTSGTTRNGEEMFDAQVVSAEHGVVLQLEALKLAFPLPASADSADDVVAVALRSTPSGEAAIPLDADLASFAIDHVTQLVAEFLGMDRSELDVDESLARYGLNSMLGLQIVKRMSELFPGVGNAALFEYPTIGMLASYLLNEHAAILARMAADTQGRKADVLSIHKRRMSQDPSRFANETQKAGALHLQVPSWLHRPQQNTHHGVAIIGVAGRYPQADDLQEFWDLLAQGKDAISEVPVDRWPLEGFYRQDRSDALRSMLSYCKWGGFLKSIDTLDHDLFELSPQDIVSVGVKDLLLIECIWSLLEDAGYTLEAFKAQTGANVGVYVGSVNGTSNYFGDQTAKHVPFTPLSSGAIANRVSEYYGFGGPSLSVDAQSASSMVAVHLACQALAAGDCEVAVASGVTVLYPELYQQMAQVGLLGASKDCRSFSGGDGMLLAEGVGAVLLKPLAQAQRDGDNIWGVIRSTVVHHRAASAASGAANYNAQVKLFAEAIETAGIPPAQINCVEAACSGSVMADALEVSALAKVFGMGQSDRHPCSIGSVKGNIGHAEAASGISQLTKVLLQMRHGKFAPSIKVGAVATFDEQMRKPFVVKHEPAAWHEDPNTSVPPRCALINSFGAGGTFASMVLEAHVAPPRAADGDSSPFQLIVLSAMGWPQLSEAALRLSRHVDAHKETLSLQDLAIRPGRDAMQVRFSGAKPR